MTAAESVRFWMRTRLARREWLSRRGMFSKRSPIRTTSAVSIATSVPAAPIARLRSEVASAGASFTPSPTIITRPSFFSSRMTRSLSSGSSSAWISSTPASSPMVFATSLWSPVSMTTFFTPSLWSCAVRARASGRMVSAIARTASVVTLSPSRRPSQMQVRPFSWRGFESSANFPNSPAPISRNQRSLPMA